MALTEVLGDLISSMIQSILNGFLLMLEFFEGNLEYAMVGSLGKVYLV